MESTSVKGVANIRNSFNMWNCDNVCKVYGKMLGPERSSRNGRKYYQHHS